MSEPSEEDLRYVAEVKALTPSARLALARSNAAARRIALQKPKKFLSMDINQQVLAIEKQLPSPSIKLGIKSLVPLLAALGLYALISWIVCSILGMIIGIPQEYARIATAANCAAIVIVGLIKQVLDGHRARKLSEIYGKDQRKIVAQLWMARMDFYLEPLENGITQAAIVAPEDPHLHEAQAILAKLRERQSADFGLQVLAFWMLLRVRRSGNDKLIDFDKYRKPSDEALLQQGMALLERVGTTHHVKTSYRGGVRVAVKTREEDGDTDPATALSDSLARKKAG